jgi:chemosensory pili system protein ChpA (sensor histidine kinase/response regulator)
MSPEAQLSDRDLFQFVLETGFSTASEVSKLAGRGVGMDVVPANQAARRFAGHRLDAGKGTHVHHASALHPRGDPGGFWSSSAIHCSRCRCRRCRAWCASARGLDARMHQRTHLRLRGEDYTIYEMQPARPVRTAPVDETQVPLLMTRSGDQRAAVRVDSVIGNREIVVKSVGPQISSVPGIFGATIMGDGSRGDDSRPGAAGAPVASRCARPSSRAGRRTCAGSHHTSACPAARRSRWSWWSTTRSRCARSPAACWNATIRSGHGEGRPRCRREVAGPHPGPDAARHRNAAHGRLRARDLHAQRSAPQGNVPIIMITSRTGEKHRQRAMEADRRRPLSRQAISGGRSCCACRRIE